MLLVTSVNLMMYELGTFYVNYYTLAKWPTAGARFCLIKTPNHEYSFLYLPIEAKLEKNHP